MERWTAFMPRSLDPHRKRPLGCIRAASAAEARRIGQHKFESVVEVARGCEPVSVGAVAATVGLVVGLPALLVFAWKKTK